jgi:hypothetical protein
MELVEDLPLSDASSFSDLGMTGTVARWQTLVGIKGGRVKDTADALRQLLHLPLDALDRSMVLAALRTIGCLSPDGTKDLAVSLEWLPEAIPDQLRKLGLLKEWANPRKRPSRLSALSKRTAEGREND